MHKRIRELFEYREMIKSLVKKELRTRYKGSFLGFLWTFANPLLQLLVYAIVFPYLMRVKEQNYAMFMFVSLVPWNYFSASLQGSCGVITGNSNLVTKIYFPREVLPLSYSLSGLCNLCFGYMIVIPMLVFFGIPITWNILWLPLLFVVQFFLCTGVSMILSAVNVYFRDLEHIISIASMALYFLTPVMYSLETLPEKLRVFIQINPMAGLVLAYRDIMYYGTSVNMQSLIYPFVASFAIFLGGFLIFGKLQKSFTEVI